MKHAPIQRFAAALACAFALGIPALASAQAWFATPDLAADALITAVAEGDHKALARVLGNDWRKLLPPEGVDPRDTQAFLDKARESRIVHTDNGRGALAVGLDAWVLPIPLVSQPDGQWRFDTQGGREAMLDRRIGLNERSAMQAALAYVDAQREYALADRNGDGLLEYARKFVSSPGKRDGLIWSASLGDESPLGEDFMPKQAGHGYHGYRFKILTGQGPTATGGARSYLIGGRMVSGFALVAWPTQYAKTGVMSFLVDHNGKLFERDLGPQTAAAAARIERFDPGAGWQAAAP